MHTKYSIFWFVILLATVCISGLNVNKAYAISYDELQDYLNSNKSVVTNTNQLNGINYLIDNEIEIMKQSWFDVNTIIMGINFGGSDGINSWEFRFYDTSDDSKMYLRKPGSTNYLNFGENVSYITITFWYRSSTGTWEIHSQSSGTTNEISATSLLAKSSQYMISNKNIYTSLNSNTIANYNFTTPFQAGPQFIPRNYVDSVFYEQTWWKLGYIDGPFDKSKCSFYFYDVTDADNLYPPMIATLGNGLKLEDDGDLQIETRLIQSYHTYDIYFLYERR